MTKINKARARKLFDDNKEIIAIPHKMNPDNQLFAMGAVLVKGMGMTFDEACNQLTYYSCSNETGRYLAFYHE